MIINLISEIVSASSDSLSSLEGLYQWERKEAKSSTIKVSITNAY